MSDHPLDPPPLRLSRLVRLGMHSLQNHRGKNALARDSSESALDPLVEIVVTESGTPDLRTGYIRSITELDHAVRAAALSEGKVELPPSSRWFSGFATAISATIRGPIDSLEVRPNPFTAFQWRNDMPTRVTTLRDFDFAASHRLAIDGESDDANFATFGKCSNKNGHGHNYRLRVGIISSCDSDPQVQFDLDTLVEYSVLRHFDHKHLNLDTPYFQTRMPSVENIALVIHELIDSALKVQSSPVDLVGVTVWETEKTSATTFPAGLHEVLFTQQTESFPK